MLRRALLLPAGLAVLLLAACDGPKINYYDSQRYDVSWLRVGGSDAMGTAGVYGSLGVPAATNQPGGRTGPVAWTDANGKFWLFGGLGYDANGTLGHLNDLWEYDGSNWTWVAGSSLVEAGATYGTQGVTDPANVPGSRNDATGWKDGAGNLLLFGGNGLDGGNALGRLNDLWKFDGSHWTWVGGSSTANQPGTYGTQGTADPANWPGARFAAAGWVADDGTIWLFGGNGYAATASDCCWLGDLWKYDGTNWTWMKGSTAANPASVYLTSTIITAADLSPGGRYGVGAWHTANSLATAGTSNEAAYIFGGIGNDTAGNRVVFNELWKFDGSNWTPVDGLTGAYSSGSYGARGEFALGNQPPSRSFPVTWHTGTSTLWMFGGAVETSLGAVAHPNDVWRFDSLGWTWVGGSSDITTDAAGTYPAIGGKGQPAGRADGVGWVDALGNLWLFGGGGRDDLWALPP